MISETSLMLKGGRSHWGRKVLSLRQQAEVTNSWLKHRMENILPEIMRRENFDMWIVIAREYNEDPVLLTLLPAWMLSARRRTILVFALQENGQVERLSLSRSGLGLEEFYQSAWNSDDGDQWDALTRIVRERDPKTIGINCSETFAFGDGLTHTEYQELVKALGPEYASRTKGAERLAIGWLERRSEPEIHAYTGIVRMAHAIIAEAFSNRIVHPGVTTADDVAWWIRQRIHDLGFRAWFQPTVRIQRQGHPQGVGANAIILPGDLLHCDVGLHYLGLATDTQQNGYVLKLGEEDAPQGLKDALATGNRLQDILAEEFVVKRTGNEILAQALHRANQKGIKASIYTHPLGFHGHGAGPTIGLVDAQQGVPGRGDYELFDDTCHAMELNIKQEIPEWDNQEVMMALEQDIIFTGGKVEYLAGRQKKLFII